MMDAVEYIKGQRKICDSYFLPAHTCKNCPFSMDRNGHGLPCALFRVQHPEEAVAIVEKWIKGGPANDKNN